jgi:hypothetical protein
MKTQTAVEWLIKNIETLVNNGYNFHPKYEEDLIEKAKQMEWEQLSDTWTDSRIEDQGDDYIGEQMTFEQYYNETFGK